MTSLTFIPPTKRKGMSKARATRIFLSRNGICYTCRTQIKQGDSWFIEHPVPVAQGGSDADEDLWPAHTKCKAVKDAVDAKSKAKRDRIITAGWAGKSKRNTIPSRPFGSQPTNTKQLDEDWNEK